MKRLFLSLFLLLVSIGANAQFTNGTVLTATALNAALAGPNITSGTINGAVIGGVTPPNATFNNLTVNGTFTAAIGTISLSGLAAQAANTVVGNFTGSSASPTANTVPNCFGNAFAITYTSASGFGCNGTVNAAQLGGATFQSPGPIGSVSPSTASFTNLSANGTVTLANGSLSLSYLATQAANTVLANVTGSSASPIAFAMPSCSTSSNALGWTTSTGFTCNTAINAATLGGATFAAPGPIGSTTPGTGAFTTLSASSTVSGAGFSTYLSSPPAIGSGTPAAGTFTTLSSTGIFTPSQTNGIVGTTTNNNANAGSVGEYITATGTGVSLTTGTNTNITSISLTAGDWDVWGNTVFIPAGSTVAGAAGFYNGVSLTSGNVDAVPSYSSLTGVTFATGNAPTLIAPMRRLSLSATTTVYLVAQANFTVSTMTATGIIQARRVR